MQNQSCKVTMKNVALIFAGGTGQRMNNAGRPKQFLELNGKPLLIYTIDVFNAHPQIDAIVVVCLRNWIPYLKAQLTRFGITKSVTVVAGGDTGQESIYNGLQAAKSAYGKNCNILIHDGVRPLISPQTISDNIEAVNEFGSCITCVEAQETVFVTQPDGSFRIPKRDNTLLARAPQTFRLSDIIDAHKRAIAEDRHDFIDSCSMMSYYGHKLHTIIGPRENIKITTPTDFFVLKALLEVRENKQIFGF